MTDYRAEERQTDDIEDRQTPISDEEIMRTIKRVSKEVEAIGQPNYPVRVDDEQTPTD